MNIQDAHIHELKCQLREAQAEVEQLEAKLRRQEQREMLGNIDRANERDALARALRAVLTSNSTGDLI